MITKKWDHIPSISEAIDLYSNYDYFIFDMDGTLLDSETIHMSALQSVMKECFSINWPMDKVMKEFVGVADTDAFVKLQSLSGLTSVELNSFLNKKHDECAFLLKEKSKKGSLLEPEMESLLKGLKENKKKLAIVTASEESFLQEVKEKIDSSYFSFTISTKDTVKTKPFPDPYLLAFEKFGGVRPKDVIIFEDSVTGLESAKRSGGIVNQAKWFEK